MRKFFAIYTILFYITLAIEVFLYREHVYEDRITVGESPRLFFYTCYLTVYSYISIAMLILNKDITGLFTFIITRIELFVTKLLLHIIIDREYYTLIATLIDLLIYLYLYFKWDNIKAMIFQEYNHRIGSDTNMRKMFILRSAYCSFQNFTYVIYSFVIFVRTLYEHDDIFSNVLLYVSIVPVFFSLVVKRFETEKEDVDAKIYAFISYLITICLLTSSYVIELSISTNRNKFFLKFVVSLDLLHFILLTIFCGLDYLSYGRGLKTFYEKKKVEKKIY